MLESTGKHVDRINILTTTDGNIGVSSMIACEFVIGVTGHRDPVASDIIELKKNIVHAIGQVRHSFEDLPVRLVTGMAEGADTLAAEVALDMGLFGHRRVANAPRILRARFPRRGIGPPERAAR